MLLTRPGKNVKKKWEREQPLTSKYINKMYVSVLLKVQRERQWRIRVIWTPKYLEPQLVQVKNPSHAESSDMSLISVINWDSGGYYVVSVQISSRVPSRLRL